MSNHRQGLPEDARAKLAPWFSAQELDAFRYTQRGPVCWAFRRVFKQGAVTWNKVVNFALSPFDPKTPWGLALIAHEMVHVRQQRRDGWLRFLVRYVWLLRKAQYRGKNNTAHPLEAPAYQLQAEVQAALENT